MQPLSPAFIDQLRFNEAGLIPAVAQDWLDGARPRKRAIQRELETPIAKAILAGIMGGKTMRNEKLDEYLSIC